MLSRGFQGDMPSLRRFRITGADLAFAVFVTGYLFTFRFYPVSEILGRFVQEILK
jgi:hypothetical protein